MGRCKPLNVDSERIAERLVVDKKTLGGVPHFILAVQMGKVEVVNTVPLSAILQAVNDINSMAKVLS